MNKVSAIICAYNEEKTISDVVLSVSKVPEINEIIIVNDGSTDDTAKIIRELKQNYNLTDIHLQENKGKGYAMAVGVENSKSELLVFCDADLSNLKEAHFSQLINPLLENEVDMVLGQATETLINYKLNPFKSFTGERCLRKNEILPILNDIKTSKFGVETLINLYYQAHEKKVKYVMLEGLKHPAKFEKTNQLTAAKEFILEGHQIAITAFNNFNLMTKIIKNNINKI